jgi:hypothetical protein
VVIDDLAASRYDGFLQVGRSHSLDGWMDVVRQQHEWLEIEISLSSPQAVTSTVDSLSRFCKLPKATTVIFMSVCSPARMLTTKFQCADFNAIQYRKILSK